MNKTSEAHYSVGWAKDGLDCGSESFKDINEVIDFIDDLRSNGYTYSVYRCEELNIADLLTIQNEGWGFYEPQH